MASQSTLDALKKIEDIATLAGLKGQIDEDRGLFVSGFGLPKDRSQMVFVRLTGEIGDGTLVTIYSACREFKKGFLKKGMTRDQAIELLELNDNLKLARYGIMNSEDAQMVVASSDVILETLDADELHHHMWSVAVAADSYEEKFGEDNF